MSFILEKFNKLNIRRLMKPSTQHASAVLALCITVGLAACTAQTETTSFVDRNLVRNARPVQMILVRAQEMGFKEIMASENAMVDKLSKHGFRALAATQLLPPTRTYTEEEAASKLSNSGADGMLVVGLKRKDMSETYVPPTFYPAQSTTETNVIGNNTIATTSHNPGYSTGGYTIQTPLSEYQAYYIDMRTGQSLWTAALDTSGFSGSSFEDLAADASKSAAERLIADGVIVPAVIQ